MGTRWEANGAPIRYPDPDIVSLDPRFDRIALGHAAIERIAGGCRFTEGPVGSATRGSFCSATSRTTGSCAGTRRPARSACSAGRRTTPTATRATAKAG